MEKNLFIFIDSNLNKYERENIFNVINSLARGVNLKLSMQYSDSTAGAIEICLEDFKNYSKINKIEGIPKLGIILKDASNYSSHILEFSKNKLIPNILQSQRIEISDPKPIISCISDGEVLATIDGIPVWVVKFQNGIRSDTIIQAKPWIINDDRVFEHLKGKFFFRLVPVIEWLRSISDWNEWNKPKLKSKIMFDDPNLHWINYGWIKFKSLAQATKSNNFNVSFAIIPIDLWFTNRRTKKNNKYE